MSARELFEQMGYEFYENDTVVDYDNDDLENASMISFSKNTKSVTIKGEIYGPCYLDADLLKAIITQVQELGWFK